MIIDDTKWKKKLPSEVYKKKVCDLPGRSEKRTLALKSKQKEFRGTLFLLGQMRFKNIFVLFLRKYIGVAEVCCLFLKINISQYQYSFANGLWYYYNCDNSKEKYWNVIQNGKKKNTNWYEYESWIFLTCKWWVKWYLTYFSYMRKYIFFQKETW